MLATKLPKLFLPKHLNQWGVVKLGTAIPGARTEGSNGHRPLFAPGARGRGAHLVAEIDEQHGLQKADQGNADLWAQMRRAAQDSAPAPVAFVH